MDFPDKTPWSDPPTSLTIKGAAVVSNFPPQIIGIGSKIYCFYIQQTGPVQPGQNFGRLTYCVLNRFASDAWLGSPGSSMIKIPIDSGFPEIATDTPALAYLGGRIHIIFPNQEKDLIHIQLNLQKSEFEFRGNLGIKSSIPPSLAVFKNLLYCVTAVTPTEKNSGGIAVMTWNEKDGWQNTNKFPFSIGRTTSPIALFELQGSLHVYFVQDSATPGDILKIWHFQCDGELGSEWNYQETSSPDFTDRTGVSGCSVIDMGYLAYRSGPLTDGKSRINIVQLPAQSLNGAGPEKLTFRALDLLIKDYPGKSYSVAPQLGIVGNTMMCIWSDRETGNLQYKTRRLLPLPPLRSWMTDLPSDRYISELTIPGSHDSAAISIVPFVNTQSLNISDQLKSGVRYFDIRAGFAYKLRFSTLATYLQGLTEEELADQLVAFHGCYPIHKVGIFSTSYLPISQLLKACYDFLDENLGEGIILQIKQDRPAPDPKSPSSVDTLFADAIMRLTTAESNLTEGGNRWRCDNTIPTIGQLRGKIQLVRRFGCVLDSNLSGINAYGSWPDNKVGPLTPITSTRFSIKVQDIFDWQNDFDVIQNKYTTVMDFIREKITDTERTNWYINFASAIALWRMFLAADVAAGWQHELMEAEGVNAKLAAFFNTAQKRAYGTIILDCCGSPEGLLLAMIRTNYLEVYGGPAGGLA